MSQALCSLKDRRIILSKYRYDPVITGIFVGIGGLILWYFSALAIDENTLPAHYDYIAKFFSVLLGAFAAFRFNAYLESRKSENEKSKFYLELCSDNYDTFFSTLDGLNNSRVDWIYAARLLMETNSLEREITTEEHQTVLGIKKMKVRHSLLNQFQVIDEVKNTIDHENDAVK